MNPFAHSFMLFQTRGSFPPRDRQGFPAFQEHQDFLWVAMGSVDTNLFPFVFQAQKSILHA